MVHTLQCYIDRTSKLRGDADQLLISYTAPYKAISRDTISWWLRKVLEEPGIDVEIFEGHSTSAASASAAKHDDVL